MAIQPGSSSSWKYDVFLSFCGVDTRENFTDHLYTVLKRKGILIFRDDEKLERGKYISTELLKAIEESKYAIIVLSRNYASSRWCLIELAKMVECMKDNGLIVLPVFYHVDPSHVRNQTGTIAETFAKHEKDPNINREDVQAWKDALKEVGNISGWHVNDSHESSDIQQILKRIFSELNFKFSSIFPKDLVGIDSRVKEVLDSYLDQGSGGVRFVGICGMNGMGKTTLAQEIYKRIFVNFEASSFIDNVREKTRNRGLVSLQNQLLSKIVMESETNIWNIYEGINVIGNIARNKKVLIVLDDVDEKEQLEALVGNCDWFGSGSRIIVTCRDSHLLMRCDMNFIYTVKQLNDNDALKLFSWRAFQKPDPKENYMVLSQAFVHYAKGLPLILKVLGSLLVDKKIDEWNSALDKLKEVEPNKSIFDILKISYDGLTNTQKELFLDIACFFKGENKDCIRDILKSFGYYPEYNIGVLIDKSLITIEPVETIWMHDLVQEMGQIIVRQESPEELGGRRRLFHCKDALFVLKNNIGVEVVEGIMLNMPIEAKECLSAEAFSKMKILRFLKIGYVHPPQDHIGGPIQLPQGLRCLSNELRIIDWHGFPLKSMPTSFQLNKLVELRMRYSDIKQLWKGIMILKELKIIDLSDSQKLIEIPDLSGVPNLKELILQRCTGLYKIHASLGDLKRLFRLDLNGCKHLKSLPHKINLEALEFFNFSGCSRLKKFPDIVENMPRLSKLCLSETAIKDLSLLVMHSTGLIELDLRDCKNLSSLPIAICSLMSLKTLNLSGCSKLDELPENLGKLEALEVLNLSGTAIESLPSSVVHLKNLKVLSLSGCVGLSSNKLTRFPLMQPGRSFAPMGMLERSLKGLCSLTQLDLSFCNVRAIPNVLGCLSSLESLNLRGNHFVSLPESIIQLSNLRNLLMGGCTRLRMLPKLPSNIKYIDARGCSSLETLSLRPEYDFQPAFSLLNCDKLITNQGCSDLFSTMLRHKDVLHVLTSKAGTEVVEVPHLDSDWADLAAMVPFHPVDQKDKGSQSLPSQSPHDRSYLARKESRWIGRLNLKPLQLLIIDWGLKMSPSQLLIIDLELMMSRKLKSLPMMMDWGIKLPSQMRVMMLPSQMRAMMNLDSQMRGIGAIEEAESPHSSTKLKSLESSLLMMDRGIKLPSRAMMNLGEIEEAESPRSSTKWKRLYLKIVESEIKEAESLPSDLLPEPSERNKLYFFFWHAYSPVMYSLYEVDVPIPLPPPPSKAVQDDRISNPKSLSPILQLKTGKYADGMCCVQLGSILYFLGGEMNIDNPYIDEDVKKELKNVKPDVLPKVVYIFDLAIDRELKDNDDFLAGTPMNYGKVSPLAFVADEKIYVIGSTIQDLEGDRIPYFEMFDPKVDKWSVLENPPEINVNTIWVGHAVVGRKALLVGWRRKKKHLYCFDLDTCEWASISIPDYAGNFSGNTEFVRNTFYGCYYDRVAAIAPLVGEEKDELKEEKEEAEEKDFQQMFKHHRLFQVSVDLGMDAIFNVPPQLQSSSSLLHLGKMYFCYVRTGMPLHPDPILASDLVIGDDKKRFISIVIFQAIGKTCDSRFFRAKFLHSEHYVVDSPFPNDGFIRGCYVFGSGSTESSKQISI